MPVQFEMLDSDGRGGSRAADGDGHAGLNRVSWDLRYEPPRLVALRTTPPENPHIWEEPRFQDRRRGRSRTGAWRRPRSGRSRRPGKYTVKLTVDGQIVHAAAGDSAARRTATATDADLDRR